MAQLFEFPQHDQTVDALVDAISQNVTSCLAKNNACSLAVAGGNTPKPFFKKLSHTPLPWDRIKITLTDERWVSRKHDESNEKMLKECLLTGLAEKAHFVSMKNKEATPEAGQSLCELTLQKSISPLNIVVLGMGEDGHFASIFPGMENTERLLNSYQPRLCLAANPEGKPPRMSLTLSYLKSADQVYLLITGEAKKHIIEQALENKLAADQYPICTLLNETDLHIYWNA